LKTISSNWKSFSYLVLLMTLMMFLSHGTQDLYPDFLLTEHHVRPATVSYVAILYNVGAVLGAILFGHLSEGIGRRRSMIAALALSLAVIPVWAFGRSLPALAFGAFFMQMGVQGAWGIIPAHLSELSPDAARSLLPGLAYQLGILIAAPTNTFEYALRDRIGYGQAMAAFEVATILIVAVIIALGSEHRGKDFMRATPASTP
jgi:SHS family lactate transporter-like MFS transporter